MSSEETEQVFAAEEIVSVEKHHVQIRLDENGPPKRDGRRGKILIEDTDAPYAVVQWLRSPSCSKASKEKIGKALFIWINDKAIPLDSLGDPDADDLHRAPPPPTPPAAGAPGIVPLSSDAMRVAASYQDRLTAITEKLETALEAAHQNHKREMAALRDIRDLEIKRCEEEIQKARDRLSKELAREEDEMALIAARRRLANVERSELASDVVKTQETFSALRERVSVLEKPSTVAQVVEGIDLLAKNEAVGDLIFRAITAWQSKGGNTQ